MTTPNLLPLARFCCQMLNWVEVVPRLQEAVAEVEDMEEIIVDLWFLGNVHQEVKQFIKAGSLEEAAHAAGEAIPEGEKIFKHALELHERRVNSPGVSPKADKAQQDPVPKVSQRILSYITAVLGVLSMRAGELNGAVDWARKSVKYNSRGLSDRKFNLACALAQRYRSNLNSEQETVKRQCLRDKAEALKILADEIRDEQCSWQEAYDDPDLKPFDKDLESLRPR